MEGHLTDMIEMDTGDDRAWVILDIENKHWMTVVNRGEGKWVLMDPLKGYVVHEGGWTHCADTLKHSYRCIRVLRGTSRENTETWESLWRELVDGTER